MSDPHIREAAESLLNSMSPHQRTLTHSVNLVSEDLVAGHRPQGKMSTVRRFFCLFVTFDLLFTSLMWLICVMIRGVNLQEIFKSEIIHYSIKSSLFDIVMLAVSRFVVLLLFYALLYINNWSIIAISTGGTCMFLIAKVFVYDWVNAPDPVYQVFLILTSFTLSWGEAWFLDFRVLPQELQAKQILESIGKHIFYVMRLIPCVGGYDEHENHSKQIDREIKHWIKSYNEAIKLLLLGTGESGKTTIIKQMKILHIQGFSLKERAEKVQHIRHNVHESIYDIVSNMPALSIPLQSPKNIQSLHYILKWGVTGPLEYTETYFDHVRVLWRDGGVRECFKRSNEYQLIDSAEYFLDRIDLIEKPDYVPSDADILRCRQKTTGIQKIEFKVKVPKSMHGGVQEFWMFDVGGQRGERKKWIQVFEGINAIWFLVACSDFDQTLREDHTQNRLIEALALFGDVWQSRFLLEAGLIVFLNKQDLLEQKLSQGRSIAPYFSQYDVFESPGDEYTRTKMFIKSLFTDIITKKRERRQVHTSAERFVIGEMRRPRECYFHFTTATDTDNVRTVFRDVHQIILTHLLNNIGVY